MWRLIFLLIALMGGFWFGKIKTNDDPKKIASKPFPLVEHKSFVIAIYAHNQADWCERTLRSIFEQDYTHYRVVMIDDASIDDTEKTAKEFILKNNQDEKVIYIRNDSFLGYYESLNRVVDHCLDREIVIPLKAKDWLSSPNVLKHFNLAYQNPDVWVALGQGIEYPAYKISEKGPISYYAALFKQVHSNKNLNKENYLNEMKKQAKGKVMCLKEPLQFLNMTL